MLDAWLNTGMSPPLQLDLAVVNNLTPPSTSPPGEASHQEVHAEHMLTSYDSGTGDITITYTPACAATGHIVYYGDLGSLATYTYSDAECSFDATGSGVFNPAATNLFFMVVGHNGVDEGSYGTLMFLSRQGKAFTFSSGTAIIHKVDFQEVNRKFKQGEAAL